MTDDEDEAGIDDARWTGEDCLSVVGRKLRESRSKAAELAIRSTQRDASGRIALSALGTNPRRLVRSRQFRFSFPLILDALSKSSESESFCLLEDKQ